MRRTGRGVDQPVRDGPVIDRPGRGDHVFASVPAGAAVAPGSGGRGHLTLHRFDVAGRDRVQRALVPGGGHAVPVGAVGAACTRTSCRSASRRATVRAGWITSRSCEGNAARSNGSPATTPPTLRTPAGS